MCLVVSGIVWVTVSQKLLMTDKNGNGTLERL